MTRRMDLVEEAMSGLADNIAVSVTYPKAGASVNVRGRKVYRSASLIKVPLVAAVYDAAERREIGLDDRMTYTEDDMTGYSKPQGIVDASELGSEFELHKIIDAVLTTSDNAGTNMLIRRIGKQRVNDLLNDWRLYGTSLGRKMGKRYAENEILDEEKRNITTADDASRMLEMLYRNEVIPYHARTMIDTMKRNRIKTKIPAGVPSNIEVANKGGGLSYKITSRPVRHDSGIVFLPCRNYIISILTEGLEPEEKQVLADISERVYRSFAK